MIFALYITACIVFLLIISVIAFFPWFKQLGANKNAHKKQSIDNQVVQNNIATFKLRLQELEQDYQQHMMDAEDYEQQKSALEKQLLVVHGQLVASTEKSGTSGLIHVPKKVLFIVLLWIPLITLSLYWLVSPRSELFKYWQAVDTFNPLVDKFLTGKIDNFPKSTDNQGLALIQAMQHNVYAHPLDEQRWAKLGSVYGFVGAGEQSLSIARRIYLLHPEDIQSQLNYVQRAIDLQTEGAAADAQALKVLDKVLREHPEHEGALMLQAMTAFKSGSYQDAVSILTTLKQAHLASKNATPDSIAMLEQTLALTRHKLQVQQEEQLHPVIADIQVLVSIAPALSAQVKNTDTLFVMVKAMQGDHMPYAVQKISAQDLANGVNVKFLASQEMMPGRSIRVAVKNHVPLVIMARVSASGNATSGAGDLESLPIPIDVKGKQQYHLVIDQQK